MFAVQRIRQLPRRRVTTTPVAHLILKVRWPDMVVVIDAICSKGSDVAAHLILTVWWPRLVVATDAICSKVSDATAVNNGRTTSHLILEIRSLRNY